MNRQPHRGQSIYDVAIDGLMWIDLVGLGSEALAELISKSNDDRMTETLTLLLAERTKQTEVNQKSFPE